MANSLTGNGLDFGSTSSERKRLTNITGEGPIYLSYSFPPGTQDPAFISFFDDETYTYTIKMTITPEKSKVYVYCNRYTSNEVRFQCPSSGIYSYVKAAEAATGSYTWKPVTVDLSGIYINVAQYPISNVVSGGTNISVSGGGSVPTYVYIVIRRVS